MIRRDCASRPEKSSAKFTPIDSKCCDWRCIHLISISSTTTYMRANEARNVYAESFWCLRKLGKELNPRHTTDMSGPRSGAAAWRGGGSRGCCVAWRWMCSEKNVPRTRSKTYESVVWDMMMSPVQVVSGSMVANAVCMLLIGMQSNGLPWASPIRYISSYRVGLESWPKVMTSLISRGVCSTWSKVGAEICNAKK